MEGVEAQGVCMCEGPGVAPHRRSSGRGASAAPAPRPSPGYPLVDAAMRQLWSMGWCHNRVRVVAASFLVKHLLLPWQWGLKHLWDCQIDADLECDALGW